MINIKTLLSLIILIILCACNSHKKSEVINGNRIIIDDMGYKIEITDIPKRVITLAPSLTEFIYDLGLEKLLVGNTTFCDYPEAAKSVEKVGDLMTINFEKILELNPDLIFVSIEGNTKESYDKLLELGFKVFVSNPRDFKGIKDSYMDFAKIFMVEEKAKARIKVWNNMVDSILTNAKNLQNVSAMFLISGDPLIVAGKGTFLNNYFHYCNIENIAPEDGNFYPMISREEVLNRNPKFIFTATDHGITNEEVKKMYPEWRSIDAVINDCVINIDPNLFYRPGPRFAEALGILYNSVK